VEQEKDDNFEVYYYKRLISIMNVFSNFHSSVAFGRGKKNLWLPRGWLAVN